MSKESKSYSIQSSLVREIESLAKKKGVPNSKIIEDAVEFYLGHRSIEGTVRSEIAKVDLGLRSVLETLLIFSEIMGESDLAGPVIAAKIGSTATDDLLKKIRMAKKGEKK